MTDCLLKNDLRKVSLFPLSGQSSSCVHARLIAREVDCQKVRVNEVLTQTIEVASACFSRRRKSSIVGSVQLGRPQSETKPFQQQSQQRPLRNHDCSPDTRIVDVHIPGKVCPSARLRRVTVASMVTLFRFGWLNVRLLFEFGCDFLEAEFRKRFR